ncbi:MAG: sigma-70 family RNA polymerase sigma factor [Planctomycetota bacterium]
MTSMEFPLIDDPPSDAPTRRSSQERDTSAQSQRNPDSARQSERQFILQLLNRDSHAWSEFVSRYEKLIVSRILSTCRECGIVSAPDLVEECGAEVMAALFQGDLNSLRQFQGRSKLSTWLAVIARRTTLNVITGQRRDKEKIRPNDSQFDIATVPQQTQQAVAAHDAEDRSEIRNVMKQLKPSDRRVLVLYFDQNLSYAEIGRALGISENAVGPKLHRAQQRLKKLMKVRNRHA